MAVESIINSTRSLLHQVLASTKFWFLWHWSFRKFTTNIWRIRWSLLWTESEFLQTSYFNKNFEYVDYTEIALGQISIRKKKGNKRILTEKDENFIYILILDSIKQLLANPRIASLLKRQQRGSKDGVYYDISDGSI